MSLGEAPSLRPAGYWIAGLSACAENQGALYSSGSYYNAFGRGYYQPYQDGSTFHYHHSYYDKANTVPEVGE